MDYQNVIADAIKNGEDISNVLASIIQESIEKGIAIEKHRQDKENNKEKKYVDREVIIKNAIYKYFEDNDVTEDLDELKGSIKRFINSKIEMDNAMSVHEKYPIIKSLGPAELMHIVQLLDTYKVVKRNKYATEESSDLMVRTDKGWYEPAESRIGKVCAELNNSLPVKRDVPEIINKIKYTIGEPVNECSNPDNTPLLNGIFNKKYWDKHHELLPYSEDSVYINPFNVEFNPDATNPKIDFDGDIFDVEEWMLELAAGNEEIRDFLWKVLSAVCLPYRRFKKAVLIYSPIGNNGKGSFLQLCRNIVGHKLCVDMAIDQFSDKNLVVNLADARLVTGDENAVDAYIDNSTHFKNAVTGDPITVDRKYKSSLTFSFNGLIIQCMNSMPMTKDKTNSFYRRLIAVPFDNCFAGVEKDEIKSKYIYDKRVLEYVVHKALMLDVQCDELVEPEAAKKLLTQYRENNDVIIQWWNETGCQLDFAWDRLPFRFLYGCFRWWCKNSTVRGDATISNAKFSREFKLKILPKMDGWMLPTNEDNKFKVTQEMRNTPEPLIGEYDIDELKNPNYTGKEWDMIGQAGLRLHKSERGIIREGVM